MFSSDGEFRSCHGSPIRLHVAGIVALHLQAHLLLHFNATSFRVSVPLIQPRNNFAVQSKGGFITAEHRYGVEKMGPDVWKTTYYPKADDHKNVEKRWYIVNAADKRLGRLASTIAIHIRGKNVPEFTPSIDMGAYDVVINAEKVGVTGVNGRRRFIGGIQAGLKV